MTANRRMSARHTSPQIQELKRLEHDSAAQSRLAATLLNPRKGLGVVQAALDVLILHPQPETRTALMDLYAHYTDQTTRDPACYVRSRIVSALRPLATPEDAPFFWAATTTYVFPPPEFAEAGGQLRANALLVLNDLDDALSRYAGARLLFDEHTASMSGEPAVTAAQVLAGLDEFVPLYAYVMQSLHQIVPEVGGQALRGLARLNPVILEEVLARHCTFEYEQGTHPPTPLLVGLFDLLLSQEPIPQTGLVYLEEFLAQNSQLELYRYLVTLLATCGLEAGWELLGRVVEREDVPARRQLVRDALDFALDPARAAPLIERLDRQQ